MLLLTSYCTTILALTSGPFCFSCYTTRKFIIIIHLIHFKTLLHTTIEDKVVTIEDKVVTIEDKVVTFGQ